MPSKSFVVSISVQKKAGLSKWATYTHEAGKQVTYTAQNELKGTHRKVGAINLRSAANRVRAFANSNPWIWVKETWGCSKCDN